MTKALYRKWRPQEWDQVVAQDHVVQTLRNAVIHDRVAHAYLFAGPRGTGKTTSARLLAKAVNCLDPDLKNRPCNQCDYCLSLNSGRFMDLIEIDAASNTSVDDVRDLRDKINFSPSQGRYKVYIIDEVHMLSTAAFNALLKTLEEPPPHAIFILATTEIHKIPATVLSRCQRHEFRRIPIADIVAHLKEKSEGEDIHVDDSVFNEIARQATGSLRDAISLLDQLTSTSEPITLTMAQNVLGTATSGRVIEIIDALIAKDFAEGLTQINQALDSGTDPRQMARQIVSYLRNILLTKFDCGTKHELPDDVYEKVNEHASLFSMPDLLRAIEDFNQAINEEHGSWHPGLGLELAFTNHLTRPDFNPPQVSQPIKDPVNEAAQEKQALAETKADISKPVTTKPKKTEPSVKETPPEVKETLSKVKPKKEAEAQAQKAEEHETTPQKNTLTINDIQHEWEKILSKIRKHNPRTQGILNSAKLTGLKENTLILGFESEMVKCFMEKEGNITLTEDVIEEVLNQHLVINCVVTKQQGGTLPADIEIDNDGMVSTATRDLGGKISSAEEEA